MLVTLGTRTRSEDLVDLLARCHFRIRQHIVLARQLAAAGSEVSFGEIRQTAAQIRRYFTLAFPLHVIDEDETIAPRLARFEPALGDVLARLSTEHVGHTPLIARLTELCSEIENDPSQRTRLSTNLSQVVELVACELAVHLELEEELIFPALQRLPEAERAKLAAAIRARRSEG